jgi:hypothetical protein
MADFQNTIDLLGDAVVLNMLLDRTIESIADDVITKVGGYAFHSCSALASVNMPNVTSLGGYAFHSCSALVSVNMPNVTSLGNYAFCNCSALTNIDLPHITTLSQYSFQYCKALTSVNMPNVTGIKSSGFDGCSALTSLDMPNVTSIGGGAFYNSKLGVLVLRASQVCTLAHTNAFTNTPFASGGTGGTVYVPQALIESYQTATNWSTLYAGGTCNFVAIEGSEYE